jgi:hypothetical protein
VRRRKLDGSRRRRTHRPGDGFNALMRGRSTALQNRAASWVITVHRVVLYGQGRSPKGGSEWTTVNVTTPAWRSAARPSALPRMSPGEVRTRGRSWQSGERKTAVGVSSKHCRVSTGHNGDDGRGHFAGFWSRQQRMGTRRNLTHSRQCTGPQL